MITKTRLLTLLFCIFVCYANSQTNADVLTNDKVLSLLNNGIQPSVVINKIKNSVTDFDVNTNDLISLNKKGVPPDVINAMIKSNNHTDNVEDNSSNSTAGASILKQWKEVSRSKNGVPEEIKADLKTQYFKDGTYEMTYNSQQINFIKKGRFELADDNKRVTLYPEKGRSYTIEIVKLTDKELEIKNSIHGDEYDSHCVVSE